MLQGKRSGSNEETIAETEAYFEAKDKSFYKKDIEMLDKRWIECIGLATKSFRFSHDFRSKFINTDKKY